MSDNRSCKAYDQKIILHPDIFINGIPVNCGNCLLWTGERCGDEPGALNMNELKESLKMCDW